MVSNLLNNAIRHGAPGRPISLDLLGNEDNVVLSVHNDGAIAEDVRDHIFDPFRSTADRRGREEGLGLGLYIVQQIVLAHGGLLGVETSAEGGTTFEVTLPRHRVAQAEVCPGNGAEGR